MSNRRKTYRDGLRAALDLIRAEAEICTETMNQTRVTVLTYERLRFCEHRLRAVAADVAQLMEDEKK